jgi:hypothetical protein
VWVVAALSLFVAVACDNGGGTPTEAEDRASAERMVLTSADLPGFVAEPDDGEDSAGPINECVDHPLFATGDVPRSADGPDLTMDAGNVRVQSGVKFAEKESDAREAFADLEAAFAGECIGDGLKASLEEAAADPGLVVGDVSSERLPALDVGDEATAYRLIAPLEVDGEQLPVHIDMTVLRDGRVIGGVFTFQAGSPFPDEERIRLTRLVADRMSGKG